MPLDLSPSDQVDRDERGRIRSIRHIDAPAQITAALLPTAGRVSAQQVAEQYLRETMGLFEMPPSMAANLTAGLQETAPVLAGPELRMQEEKDAKDSVTVRYAHTDLGIPVFNSGVSVLIQKDGMKVLSADNDLDYDLGPVTPPPPAGYLPRTLTGEQLRTLLGLPANTQCQIVQKRLLIYRYIPEERTEDADVRTNEEGRSMAFEKSLPEIPLPAVSPNIVSGRAYVVTDVNFLLPTSSRPRLAWKAFVEPATGSVLRLRPGVASATACVFIPEPTTQGSPATSASTPSTLSALTNVVNLVGLGPVVPATATQALNGRFVEVKNFSSPPSVAPTTTSPFKFCFPAKSTDFAAASAYHHCDSLFRLVETMGFPVASYFDGTTFPVPVDHDGFGGQVNAQAPGNPTFNGSGGFEFGLANLGGPMGIAADARIAWHEFGHAILWDHVSSPNFGFAHSPGDSLGAILFDPDSKLTGAARFETFPFMAVSNGLSRRHDRDVNLGWAWFGSNYNTQYLGEQVLSTTLFRIYRASGGDSSDVQEKRRASRYMIFLILKAIESLVAQSKRPEVLVNALIAADRTTTAFEGTPGGALGKVIRWSFEKQGLFQPPGSPLPVQSEGAPPAVDVFIDDGRQGEYMAYLPNGGVSNDIVNRKTSAPSTMNEPPVTGVTNFLFVRISNRGTSPAIGITVSAFQTPTATSHEWDPGNWSPLGPAVAVPGPLAPGASLVAGPMAWIPASASPVVLVAVESAADRSNLATVTTPISTKQMTLLDNNIKFRQF